MKKLLFSLICILISLLLFILSFLKPEVLLTSKDTTTTNKKPCIIIDSGHGGFDGGASTDDGYPEKHINLNISLYLNDYLTALGYETLLTRSKDESLEDSDLTTIRKRKTSDLHNRMKIMEETENAIYISIHQNHFHKKNTRVCRCFIHRPSVTKAQYLQRQFKNVPQKICNPITQEKSKNVHLLYF